MKLIKPLWRYRLRDTVARWIALTIIMAMLTALAFNALFVQLAGVWAYPPLAETGLLEKSAAIVRMVEASEPGQRSRLAASVSTDHLSIVWQATRQGLDLPLLEDSEYRDGSEAFRALLGPPQRHIEAYQPSDWRSDQGRYALLVQLSDQSWLMFSSASRSWGLEEGTRNLIVIALVLISTGLVALIATRRLAKPLQQFAQGARRFAVDFRAPPIDPVGPRDPSGDSCLQRHAGAVAALHQGPHPDARGHLP